jgi:DNA-binding transcriptional regulator YdaS (Cro superfamily)
MSEQQTSGVMDAITAAGGQGSLARKVGVSQQAVSQWAKRGWVPLEHIVEVERLFGVPRDRLINPKHDPSIR